MTTTPLNIKTEPRKTKETIETITAVAAIPLLVTEELQKQINYLHSKHNVEWSGFLLYNFKVKDSVKEEDIRGDILSNPKIYEIIAEDFLLCDIGTSGYTNFDPGEHYEDLLAYLTSIGKSVEDYKVGLLHTHHSMKAFFSGTDLDELVDNTKFHAAYLSLIVNKEKEYVAKLAFPAKQEKFNRNKVTFTAFDEKSYIWGKDDDEEEEKDIVAVYECKVKIAIPEIVLPEFVIEREKKISSSKVVTYGYQSYNRGTSTVPTYNKVKHYNRISEPYSTIKNSDIDNDMQSATAFTRMLIKACIPKKFTNTHKIQIDNLNFCYGTLVYVSENLISMFKMNGDKPKTVEDRCEERFAEAIHENLPKILDEYLENCVLSKNGKVHKGEISVYHKANFVNNCLIEELDSYANKLTYKDVANLTNIILWCYEYYLVEVIKVGARWKQVAN